MPFDQKTIDTLRATVDSACFDHRTGLPGATVVVVGKDGSELFAHSAGRRGVASLEDMSLDNAFWIASCTKAVTGIAVSTIASVWWSFFQSHIDLRTDHCLCLGSSVR